MVDQAKVIEKQCYAITKNTITWIISFRNILYIKSTIALVSLWVCFFYVCHHFSSVHPFYFNYLFVIILCCPSFLFNTYICVCHHFILSILFILPLCLSSFCTVRPFYFTPMCLSSFYTVHPFYFRPCNVCRPQYQWQTLPAF